MKSILEKLFIILLFIYFSPKANALSVSESNYYGVKRGQAICKAVWFENSQTKTEALVSSYDYVEIEINKFRGQERLIDTIEKKYGTNHPIPKAYYQSANNTIHQNCGTEYRALPNT